MSFFSKFKDVKEPIALIIEAPLIYLVFNETDNTFDVDKISKIN